ncbi:secondary thiamine-phosphate synthase enzyme YjbQ [Magnetospira thiophila]
MRQIQTYLDVSTGGRGLHEITVQVQRWIHDSGFQNGLLTVYIRHTSASLTIQENADPAVQRDLDQFFCRLVPENQPWFTHQNEGPDDMPAHIKCALTNTSVSVPVAGRRALFGTWQGLYVFEHRARPHQRQVVLHLLGD